MSLDLSKYAISCLHCSAALLEPLRSAGIATIADLEAFPDERRALHRLPGLNRVQARAIDAALWSWWSVKVPSAPLPGDDWWERRYRELIAEGEAACA